jgi:RimJ/RimL family protein N-acetyltransferase
MVLPERIETKRLTLRAFSPADVDAVLEYSNDPEWSRFQQMPSPFSRADAESRVAELIARDRNTQPTWAMTLGEQVIGIVRLSFECDHRIAVLGYGVHKKHWGEGLSREGARSVVDLAFAHYEQLRRIRAQTDLRNARSIRVLEKLGFTHEGTLRANTFEKGEFVDETVFGLLREEWFG